MFFMTIMFLSLMLNIIFMMSSHPMMMMFTIILQTLMICLLTGLISQSFWFSYILFLVFLGGMLVLFIYITSLASNEMFNIQAKHFIIFIFPLILLMFFLIDPFMLMPISTNNDMSTFIENNIYIYSEMNFSLNKLFNESTNIITLMLVLYLFLTLIMVVKITNIFQGPLRQKN
uniref:NADH-ubiquinone oxidoreductase chain 6 n=1 Tax=Ischyroplectron isolatum TaxID=3073460 RepID=A0AAU7BAE7_9ORTH